MDVADCLRYGALDLSECATREDEAFKAVSYEVEMCAVAAARRLVMGDRPADQVLANACLEVTLLHARAMMEFLLDGANARGDDLTARHFAPRWTPAPAIAAQAAERLIARRGDINKHLAHLTWARVDGGGADTQWFFSQIAVDVVVLTEHWLHHVAACRDEAFDDPQFHGRVLRRGIGIASTALREAAAVREAVASGPPSLSATPAAPVQ